MDEKELLAMLVTDRIARLALGVRLRHLREIELRTGKRVPETEEPPSDDFLEEAVALFKRRHERIMTLLR